MRQGRMDPNEAARKRVARYTTDDGSLRVVIGEEIHSVSTLGVIVATGRGRILIPWHNVFDFIYDVDDAFVRKVIQGE